MTDRDERTPRQGRIAPSSPEAEEAVLGSILLAPETLLDVKRHLKPEDFFIVRNGWIFESMLALYEEGAGIDELTLIRHLRDRTQDGKNVLDLIGGSSYITSLINNTPTFAHAATYAQMVARCADRRKGLTLLGQCAQIILEDSETVENIKTKVASLIGDWAAANREVANRPRTLEDLTDWHFDIVEKRQQLNGALPGVPAGLGVIDDRVLGLQRGHLGIWGGRTGTFKTATMLNIVHNGARDYDARIFVASLEMDYEEVMDRLTLLEVNIPGWKLKTGRLDEREWSAFVDSRQQLRKLKIRVVHFTKPFTSADDIIAPAREMAREVGLDEVWVDYLGLMSGDDDAKQRQRNYELKEIARRMKLFAGEAQTYVGLLSQLKRDADDRRPKKSDLADASIETDADHIFLLDFEQKRDKNSMRPNQLDLILAKHRHGPEDGEEVVRVDLARMKLMDFKASTHSIDLTRFGGFEPSGNGYSHPPERDGER